MVWKKIFSATLLWSYWNISGHLFWGHQKLLDQVNQGWCRLIFQSLFLCENSSSFQRKRSGSLWTEFYSLYHCGLSGNFQWQSPGSSHHGLLMWLKPSSTEKTKISSSMKRVKGIILLSFDLWSSVWGLMWPVKTPESQCLKTVPGSWISGSAGVVLQASGCWSSFRYALHTFHSAARARLSHGRWRRCKRPSQITQRTFKSSFV